MEKGHDVHLISDLRPEIEGVNFHPLKNWLPGRRTNLFFWSFQARKIIKKIKPEILHAHYVTSYGFVGALSGFHPLVISAWGDDIATFPEISFLHKAFVKFILRRADLVHTHDEMGKKRLLELGCDEEKILVQFKGVDLEKFSPEKGSKTLRKKLDLKGKFTVINARHLDPNYSVDTFIKAAADVSKERKDVVFILVGKGPLENKFRRMVKELKLDEYFRFLGGISHSEMPTYLASMDLYVDTFSDIKKDGIIRKGGGGIGTTTAEAMASGIPALLGDRKSVLNCQWFKGIVYKQLNPEDLADKILTILDDDGLRKRISKESLKAAKENADWRRNMVNIEKAYDRLLG
ncbi:MAG: hypothetical protein A7315_02090 [Candidatus Altiarchaeales archaeon WOR_SM1_79]|nr:MAG: hypothetical protein A7315_02090 [Candidatus Altiarchaeales archaeon WOR_SM1_79]